MFRLCFFSEPFGATRFELPGVGPDRVGGLARRTAAGPGENQTRHGKEKMGGDRGHAPELAWYVLSAMIGRLAGDQLFEQPDGTVLLQVGGVGYELLVPAGSSSRFSRDEAGRLTIFVHTHWRHDQLELFGFASELEKRVFRLLVSVPNVGPKTALGVLGHLSPDELANAVREEDSSRIAQVPGIGKKTAERVVLELKTRLDALGSPSSSGAGLRRAPSSERLMAALTNMGYRATEAERAVRSLENVDAERPLAELLREALALLSR